MMLEFFQAYAYLSKYFKDVGLDIQPMPDQLTDETMIETIRNLIRTCIVHEGVDAEFTGIIFEFWMGLAPMLSFAEKGCFYAQDDVEAMTRRVAQYDGPQPPLLVDAINRWAHISTMLADKQHPTYFYFPKECQTQA